MFRSHSFPPWMSRGANSHMVARVVVRDAPKVPQVLADWESKGIFCLAAPSDPQEVVVGRGCLGERLLLGTHAYVYTCVRLRYSTCMAIVLSGR